MNSFNLTLSGKHFVYPSVLTNSFAGESNLGCRSSLFITLNPCCQSLACKVFFWEISWQSYGNSFVGKSLLFSAAFKILFIFDIWHFNYDVSWCGPLWVQLVWDSELPGLVCLFPLPDWGTFLSLFFQISFQFLALPLLLLTPLWFRCWYI